MADDEIQKEPPQIQKEPPRPEARVGQGPLGDDYNRFRRPERLRNWMALTAFILGNASVIIGLCPGWLPYGPFAIRFGWIDLLLGPAALLFGMLGIRYRIRHPSAGGLGYAISGIVLGVVPALIFSGWLYVILHTGFAP
jgi:hypothetical protein